jgi:hypothetical protein
MKGKARKQALDAVMPHVSQSRRQFTKRLVGAVFAVPAMMSFPLDDVAFGSATVSAQTIYPSHPSTVQLAISSPAARYYCVPEDPTRRAFTPQ